MKTDNRSTQVPAAGASDLPELPCCPVHENLLRTGKVKPFDNCVVCTRNHRDSLITDLASAENLLKRGQKALNRVGWEKGETDAEWSQKVATFLGYLKNQREYERRKPAAPEVG